MLQRPHPQLSDSTVACVMVMRCGNCRRMVRPSFVVPAGTPNRVQRAIDAAALELWSAFMCEACDYDKAYVMALGIEPSL